MLAEDGFDDGAFGKSFPGLAWLLARFLFRLEVVDVEAENVSVLNGVGDGVGMELLLEKLLGGVHRGLLVLDLHADRVFFKDGCAREAEELRFGEELFDGFVVVAELRAVAFVEDEGDAFVLQRLQHFLVGRLIVLLPLLVAFAGFV